MAFINSEERSLFESLLCKDKSVGLHLLHSPVITKHAEGLSVEGRVTLADGDSSWPISDMMGTSHAPLPAQKKTVSGVAPHRVRNHGNPPWSIAMHALHVKKKKSGLESGEHVLILL